jgi:hypothetical protein
MEIGGACASGQTGYEIAVECPEGTWAVPVSIFAGMIGLGVYAGASGALPGPRWTPLAWPALFLSLGWNFWEFGLDPPPESGMGISWGWVICGVLFVAMGGIPLVLAVVSRSARRRLFWSDAPPRVIRTRITAAELAARNPGMRLAGRTVEEVFGDAPPSGGAPVVTGPVRPASSAQASPAPPPSPPPSPPAASVVGVEVAEVPSRLAADLERLAALRRRGDLSEDEFRSAKARLLEGEPSP